VADVLDFSLMFFFAMPPWELGRKGVNSHWFGRSRNGDLSHKPAESQSHILRISTVWKLVYFP